jgi:hypothetical protein
LNTGPVTTSGTRARHHWTRTAGYLVVALVAVYGFLVLATEFPVVTFFLVVVAVVVLDGLLLVLAARRRSRRVALWSGAVALLAALVQTIWVYIPFAWDVLAPDSNGVAWFGSALALALLVSVALSVRRDSRPFGWAVLMGSAQGFAASFLAIVAAFAAAMGGD